MRVLAVDDDPVTCAMVRRVLETAGYQVQVALTGTEGADLWRSERPDIVITDWVMPGLSGDELCRLIRRTQAERYTYIIMLTACNAADEVREGLRAGADDYLTKPCHPEELLLRVNVGRRVVSLEKSLLDRVAQLEEALAAIRTLQGLLPICAYCKKIRQDDGYWAEIEAYIEQNTDAIFTHGLCPDCLRRHVMPELEALRQAQEKEQ